MIQTQILEQIRSDRTRMEILAAAASLNLSDWCIAAGFIRSLVWDYFHQYQLPTPIDDIDLIHFNNTDTSPQNDRKIEHQLQKLKTGNWSVKNQARMHLRNNDVPYRSTVDAMSYWPEVETAVGVTLVDGLPKLVSPFRLQSVLRNTVTLNSKRPKPEIFYRRIKDKDWLQRWPRLEIQA